MGPAVAVPPHTTKPPIRDYLGFPFCGEELLQGGPYPLNELGFRGLGAYATWGRGIAAQGLGLKV